MCDKNVTLGCPPAEWSSHSAMWTAWPADAELWGDNLADAQAEVAAMCWALSEAHEGRDGDQIRLLVRDEDALKSARRSLGKLADYVVSPYGDIWVRDTGPVFLSRNAAIGFKFNGWGGKYELAHDDTVADRLAAHADASLNRFDCVLEGGAIEGDGEGTFLTTRQCLLNANRNPDWTSEAKAEAFLGETLGAKKVIWLDDGLANDHTDGHVDNLARFVAPGVVVCQEPCGPEDPNGHILEEVYQALCNATDAAGRSLQVKRIPSPGRIKLDGEIVPASHMNFVIGNASVVLPLYADTPSSAQDEAVATLEDLFPDRRVLGLPSDHILTGGGSFHCITQQQPAGG